MRRLSPTEKTITLNVRVPTGLRDAAKAAGIRLGATSREAIARAVEQKKKEKAEIEGAAASKQPAQSTATMSPESKQDVTG